MWRQSRQKRMFLSLSMEPGIIGTVFVLEAEVVVKVEADKVEVDVVESLMIARTSLERTEETRMGK